LELTGTRSEKEGYIGEANKGGKKGSVTVMRHISLVPLSCKTAKLSVKKTRGIFYLP
jgi:hypothetical protein